MGVKMTYHKEAMDNEVFVGNCPGWKTDKKLKELTDAGILCRLGNDAYDINGKLISIGEYPNRPLFVKQESLIKYDEYMTNKNKIYSNRR